MNAKLGLSPEEMLSIYNGMYTTMWSKRKEGIECQIASISESIKSDSNADIVDKLLEIMDIALTCSRDSAILTMLENNDRIVENLHKLGILVSDNEVEE